jgi:hypothetical protein
MFAAKGYDLRNRRPISGVSRFWSWTALKFILLGRAGVWTDKYHSDQDEQEPKNSGQQEQKTQNNGLDYAAQNAKQGSGHGEILPECCGKTKNFAAA